MIIVFDHDVNPDGSVMALHTIETTDPGVLATFAAISGSAALQAQAGYGKVHKVGRNPGNETRYGAVLRQLAGAPADDPLKVQGPK